MLTGGASAQFDPAKGGLSALFGYSSFYLPEEGKPYVETYLDFDASTLKFARTGDFTHRATVEITLVVRRSDSVVYVKKYDLNSPTVTDPKQNYFTFLDLQRFYLDNGIYDLEFSLRDKVSGADPTVFTDKMIVYYGQGKPSLSSVQLMSKVSPTDQENILSRAGMDMLPYVNDFMPASVTSLKPYFEIYNLTREQVGGEHFDVVCYIVKKETGQKSPASSRAAAMPFRARLSPFSRSWTSPPCLRATTSWRLTSATPRARPCCRLPWLSSVPIPRCRRTSARWM